MKNNLKVFVWRQFSPDYTDGLAFAIAETTQEAQELVEASLGYELSPYAWGKCEEFPIGKFAAAVHGGS